MSFGKLNILQHKSWNVWNRDNIEKVLRDERQHKEKEDKERQRQEELNSESRTQLLRKRKRDSNDAEGFEDGPSAGTIGSHQCAAVKHAVPEEHGHELVAVSQQHGFKLFDELDTPCSNQGTNAEREEEKRQEKEKNDRQWGLVGLGQDNLTGSSYGDKPWYTTAQTKDAAAYQGRGQASAAHGSKPHGLSEAADQMKRRDDKLKSSEDPLNDMHKYLKDTKRAKEHKKDKKDKKDSKSSKKHWGENGGTDKSEAEKAQMMEKLRRERVERERYERERVAAIMSGVAQPTFSAPQSERTQSDDPSLDDIGAHADLDIVRALLNFMGEWLEIDQQGDQQGDGEACTR